MVARQVPVPFDPEGWLFELKWEGLRAAARLQTWSCRMARTLDHEIVKGGVRLVAQTGCTQRPDTGGLEFQAREAKRGLWVLRDPVPPWEFRSNKLALYTEKERCQTASDGLPF
jgi:hypothetical protein